MHNSKLPMFGTVLRKNSLNAIMLHKGYEFIGAILN